MCMSMKNNFNEEFVVNNVYYNVKDKQSPLGKSFNIDEQCDSNMGKYLGWKCWWRDNQSDSTVPKDNSFDNTAFRRYLDNTPLKYDGVFKLY